MPQSEEHLNILKGLKINQGFAVITKTDLVSRARVEEVKEFVQQKIGGCSVFEFNPKQLELLTSIRKEIEKFSTLKPIAKFSKVYIDRVFSPKGLGAVVTGTLSSGKVSIGDSLMLYPEKREVSVKKIQTYHQDKQEVAASERVALQLSKVSISDLRRGQLLSSNKNIELTKSIEAQIDFSVELKKNIETWFYTGTLKQKCRIIPYKELPNFFRVKFDKAVALNPLESFILRNSSDEKTIGFGVVANTKLVANKHALSVAALKQWQATPEGYLRFQEFLKPKETKVLSNKEVEEQFYLAEKDKFLEPYKSNIEPFKLQKDALVQKMILKKDLMYLSEEHYLSKEAYDVLSEKVKNYISTNGQASTSELREHMGLSRKYVVMILESFDRNRLTYLRDGVRKLLKTFVLLSFLTSSIFAHKKDCVKEVIDYSEQATINALCLHDIIPDTVKVSLFFIYPFVYKPLWIKVSYFWKPKIIKMSCV
jgi:selenocysteine-specific elongation factor